MKKCLHLKSKCNTPRQTDKHTYGERRQDDRATKEEREAAELKVSFLGLDVGGLSNVS